MNRVKAQKYFMDLAKVAAKQSTCLRSQVGCVLTTADHRVLSIAYNGSPPGLKNCDDTNCGPNITPCKSIHAEQNAIVFCSEPFKVYKVCYTTLSPCYACLKLLIAANVKEIYFLELYREHEKEQALANEAGILFEQLKFD